jgi:hypothetical protein
MRKLLWAAMLLVAACSNVTTETGYVPRKLGDPPAMQRAYYAQPFSPAAEGAGEPNPLRRPVP